MWFKKFIIEKVIQHRVAPKWLIKSMIMSDRWAGVTILWFIFYREEKYMDREKYESLYIHEVTHVLQQIELLFIPCFLIYFGHLLYGWIKLGTYYKGYKNCIMEVEANANEIEYKDVIERPWYNWVKYLKK